MPHWREGLDPDRPFGRYLSWKEVKSSTGLSRTTAWRLQKRDEFPAPYAISPGRVAYREDEVDAWRRSRAPRRAAAVAAQAPAERPIRDAPASRPGPGAPPAGALPSRSASRTTLRRSQHAKAIAQQMRFDF